MAQEGRVIALPAVGLAAHPSALARAEAASTEGEAQHFVVLSLEVRRVAALRSPIPAEAVPKVLNRCILAALEALARSGVVPVLSGTAESQALEARFEGPGAASEADRAAAAARAAVRRAQRTHEREFQATVGLAAGRVVNRSDGIRIESGRPELVARRLRGEAPPGQVLAEPGPMDAGLARP